MVQRIEWKGNAGAAETSNRTKDKEAKKSWPSAIELYYTNKGVVGVRNQTDVIQEIGRRMVELLIEDVFFYIAYPPPPIKFRRYKGFLIDCIEYLQEEHSGALDKLRGLVRERAEEDVSYASGIISMVSGQRIMIYETNLPQ